MPILQWLTREDDLKAAGRTPYRLLEEAPDLGAGDRETGNMLIQGDNLEALKALLPFYAVLFLVLMAVTYIPALSLWLPSVVL